MAVQSAVRAWYDRPVLEQVDDMDETEGLGERLARFGGKLADEGEEAVAKREFAAALREVLDELDRGALSGRRFEDEAARLRALAGELRENAVPRAPRGPGGYTGMENFHDRSPIVGQANPIAPPASLEHFPEERCVRGEVEFGKAFEGAPGLVHGGFLAALLDEALGCVTVYSGTSGMTGEYTLRFEHPTRIKVPLRFEARFDRSEGRKLYVSADLWDGDQRTVKAKGTFIAVGADRFESFEAARTERIGRR